MPSSRRSTSLRPSPSEDTTPRFRSGAVARMVRIPVATLRIWESRYRVAQPDTTDAGHRLYSAADVQRLALLKQLTEVGHAIGTLASLSMKQLQRVAATHAGALAGAAAEPAQPRAWHVVVVGALLAERLRRPAVARRVERPVVVAATFESLADAIAAPSGRRIDALLVHAPLLRDDALAPLHKAAKTLGARRIGVLHGFTSTTTGEAFDRAGVSLLREPQDDRALAGWLQALAATHGGDSPAGGSPAQTSLSTGNSTGRRSEPFDPAWPVGVVPPRRYDDATLADFAGLSSTIACECPRQVAELLTQLSGFEAYSAECANRSTRDEAMHGYLERVAGAARALFETALERVAVAEGLVLRPKRANTRRVLP